MKKITFFTILSVAFMSLTIKCNCTKDDLIKDALNKYPNPQRIVGVFQTPTGDIISLNNTGEFLIIESIRGNNIRTGSYSINDLGLLEFRVPGSTSYELTRDSSGQVSSIVDVTGNSFNRILSREEYSRPVFNGINSRFIGIHHNDQGFSLDLTLSRFRIAQITRPDVPGRYFGGYFTRNANKETGDDEAVFVVSNRGRAFHRIIRNSNRYVSNLSFDVGRHQSSIIIHRQDLIYSDDQLNLINSSIIGRYRVTLLNGNSADFSIITPNIHYHTIRGQRVFVDLSALQPILAQMGIIHNDLDDQYIIGDNQESIPIGTNGNHIYIVEAVFSPNSVTEVIGFRSLNDSNSIKSIKKIFPRPPGQ